MLTYKSPALADTINKPSKTQGHQTEKQQMDYEAFNRNMRLIEKRHELRAEIQVWASGAGLLDGALALAEFEASLLDAVKGGTEWQGYTGSALLEALGYCTLADRVGE